MKTILMALVATALAGSPPVDLCGLSTAPVGDGLPVGWQVKPVPGVPPPRFSVQLEDGEPVLHVEGMGMAAWAYHELEAPISDQAGHLRWSWRVLKLPSGADLRMREKDDAALRLFVVFGKSGGLARLRSRVIFYTWGNAEPEGLSRSSFASEKLHIIKVAGAMEVGRAWRQQEVEPFADYRRYWDREPPPITAIGLLQDTDMTGAMAVSELRSLDWLPP